MIMKRLTLAFSAWLALAGMQTPPPAQPQAPLSLPDLPEFLTGHIEPLLGIEDSNDGDGSRTQEALFGSLAGAPMAEAGPGGVADNPWAGEDISRNAPCPCGSGNKYKHCHGAVGAKTPA